MTTDNISKQREEAIKIVEAELKELKAELVSIAKEIKEVKDSQTRKALFSDKKQIQSDIEEATKQLAMLKGEDESMPSSDLEELLDDDENETNETENINEEK